MKKLNHSEFPIAIKELNINIFISSSSFEDRCFVTPTLLSECSDIEYAYFYNENEDDIIVSNAEKLSLINKKSSKFAMNSDEPIGIYTIIDNFLTELLCNYKKPNILIDITTFTHEALLILLKALEIKKEFLGEIHYSYVGAKDYSHNFVDDKDKWLSKGIKTIRTVLGYSGLTDPIQKNHLMILFGFESERTRKIIEEYEFDFISLGFAKVDESIQSNHFKINYERHKDLLKEYPNAKEFNFSLIDAYQTKNHILTYLKLGEFSSYNTVIAPLNTKISTVGAGLAAMCNR